MALLQGDTPLGNRPVPTPSTAAETTAAVFEYKFAAGKTASVGDIIEIGVLPAYAIPVDAHLDVDDLDTNGTPTITLDVGLMSGQVGALLNDDASARTIGSEFFAAATQAQAGGFARMTKSPKAITADNTKDRSIGVKLAAGAATFNAAGGTIRVVVFFRQGLIA